jgi:hypothetical protein
MVAAAFEAGRAGGPFRLSTSLAPIHSDATPPPVAPTPPTRNTEGDSDAAAFLTAAVRAGLSRSDADARQRDRGPVSCKQLTEFIAGEVKEGRRGKDLKKDLEFFIKVYKEKSGK